MNRDDTIVSNNLIMFVHNFLFSSVALLAV